MDDDYNISIRVFACGHESFVPVPKSKWREIYDKPVRYNIKCDNCNFPKLLARFRLFNNPSTPLWYSKMSKLAFEMFDSRHILSVENVDMLMRHWMRAIQSHICEESKHRALFDLLADSVKDMDGALAGKEMKALLESGYVRFIKNGRGYMRPITRRRQDMTITMDSLSRPGSAIGYHNPPNTPNPELPLTPTDSRSFSPINLPTSPQSDTSSRRDEVGKIISRLSATELVAVKEEYENEEEEYTDEEAARLRVALERLHKASASLKWPTQSWGNLKAQTDIIDKYCEDLERPPVTFAEKALHYRYLPLRERELEGAPEIDEDGFILEDKKKYERL
ncbi:hypothetical protein F5Y17DRAFT_475097 [Xylariaceae sp. FL0594]|nr:hypothetical protein F5Y17DRAFT_475097 [Xylariaceae sp. FL0594]